MDHVVYVDAKANELEKILSGEKSIILRGAAGRKLPYGRVEVGDILYFIRNNSEGLIQAKAQVDNVYNSEKMDKGTSAALIEEHLENLQLSPAQLKRWSGKRYLVLITITNPEAVTPFGIDKSEFGNMDDWLPVGDIDSVRI
ncbi:MAG: hypothetical protein K8R40_09470 [Anaerolineaceae bacterium]|nr:hypothetical protein [Anaerolineaceae bacterium]